MPQVHIEIEVFGAYYNFWPKEGKLG